MKKIIENTEEFLKLLASVPYDKALHFMFGHLIFNFFVIFFGNFIALGIIVTLATVKEVYDYYVPGHEASVMDIVYGIAPGVIQTLIGL